eukprot:829976-Karenia_brevis.AAC.1
MLARIRAKRSSIEQKCAKIGENARPRRHLAPMDPIYPVDPIGQWTRWPIGQMGHMDRMGLM